MRCSTWIAQTCHLTVLAHILMRADSFCSSLCSHCIGLLSSGVANYEHWSEQSNMAPSCFAGMLLTKFLFNQPQRAALTIGAL
jgi:hypothetical protein